MRHLIAVLTLVLSGLAALPAQAQSLSGEEKTFIDKHLTDVVTTETTRLTDAAMTKVFAAPFYKINIVIKEDGGSSTSSLIAVRVEDKLMNVSSPGTDTDLPQWVKMMDPKFKLAADADAEAVQKCFDVLFPPFGSEDKKLIKFTHKGNQWTFVRGKFFDDFSGFILTTGADGTVTGVKYMLRLP